MFEAIDGNTSGKESWTGPIGKMLPKVLELPLDPDFTVIDGGDLPDLSGERKQKQRDNEERLKEAKRVAKYREAKKEENGEATKKSLAKNTK